MPSEFAVIFDMDGVIFDTETIALKCWSKSAETLSLPENVPLLPFSAEKGLGRDELIRFISGEVDA